ncbi:lectin alpha chain-like [Tasmannia lanceolata]|uniref:lectin alpha chain-like n=1 Tax=Tasmannia lanceolata TaxID=3420 RepID=UPI0040639271
MEKLQIIVSAVIVLTWLSISTAKEPQTFSMTFGQFETIDYTTITTLNDASITGNALQITPNSLNTDFTLSNRYGRAMFSKPFRLWEGHENFTGTVASFSTSFLVNILRPYNLTRRTRFSHCPKSRNPRRKQRTVVLALHLVFNIGSLLGFDLKTYCNSSNQFIAIELDTFKEDFDPNNNHIGLNINSIKSNLTYNFSDVGIELAPETPTNYTIGVDYKGNTTVMDVYIGPQEKLKPNISIIQRSINLKEIVAKESYFRFSASTGSTYQVNSVLGWNLTVEILPSDNNSTSVKLMLAIGIPILGLKIKDDPRILVTLRSLPHTPREFRFKDLKKATNNFDEKNKLGQYKGILAKENMEVAVEKFSRGNIEKERKECTVVFTVVQPKSRTHIHSTKIRGGFTNRTPYNCSPIHYNSPLRWFHASSLAQGSSGFHPSYTQYEVAPHLITRQQGSSGCPTP